jgi:hypothetical protein
MDNEERRMTKHQLLVMINEAHNNGTLRTEDALRAIADLCDGSTPLQALEDRVKIAISAKKSIDQAIDHLIMRIRNRTPNP